MSLDSRNSRFLRALELTRWYRGRPGQLWVSVQEHKGTLLLELSKALRIADGWTSGGKKKPHRYKQTSRAFCYNLADREHLVAFLNTFSHMTAMAAGLEAHPIKNGLNFLERRVLKTSPLRLRGVGDGDVVDGYELLELVCENANHRAPTHKLLSRNPENRKRAAEERRRKCWPKKQYTFRIRRVVSRYQRGCTVNDSTVLEVPLEVVQKLAAVVGELLKEVWFYLVAHREQAELRYDHPQRTRWQLHHPPALDWLIPQLDAALTYREESALFESPELYEDVPRLQREVVEPKLSDYHPVYLRRLLAYGDGSLVWRSHWRMPELHAQGDLLRVRKLLWRGVERKLMEFVWTWLVLQLLHRDRRTNPSEFPNPPRIVDCWSIEHQVIHQARGPP